MERAEVPSSDLPRNLVTILQKLVTVFETAKIDYWLGGGLYQLLEKKNFDSITLNWEKHDIDIHILEKDSDKVMDSLKENGYPNPTFYTSHSGESIKIAFEDSGILVETPFLFPSKHDGNVVYFISWGKKEYWPLTETERQLFYYFSLPKKVFAEEHYIKIDKSRVKVPSKEYIDLLYPNRPANS